MKLATQLSACVMLCMGLLLAEPVQAQTDSLIISAKKVLLNGTNINNGDMIQQARSMFERAASDPDYTPLAHYYMALAEYRLASGSAEKAEQLEHLNKGITLLEKAIELDDASAEAYALMGSMLGWKAGLKPMQSMFLGPKASGMISKAEKLAPENPRVVMVRAISDYNTPSMFGGDRERAMKGFKRAASYFETQESVDPLEPEWGHSDTYAWMGQAFMEQEAYAQAEAAFEEALAINPDNGWVKRVLLPQLQQMNKAPQSN